MLTNDFIAGVEASARREQIRNARRSAKTWIRKR